MKKWMYEEATLIRAFVILLFLLFIMYFMPAGPEIPATSHSILDYFLSVMLLVSTLICIRYIQIEKVHFSIWGYIWRHYVTFFVALALMVFIDYVLAGKIVFNARSTEFNQIVLIVLTPLVVWALYCKQRVDYLKKALMYFKGYPIS